jgi:hypothetical protein
VAARGSSAPLHALPTTSASAAMIHPRRRTIVSYVPRGCMHAAT